MPGNLRILIHLSNMQTILLQMERRLVCGLLREDIFIRKMNEIIQYVILLIVVLAIVGHCMYHDKKDGQSPERDREKTVKISG